jgi:peptidoglycan/LPS O-acetylase OafA/YrhL
VSRSYQRRQSLLVYLEARILRIYPALWLNLLLVTLVLGLAVSTLGWRDYLTHQGSWGYLLHNAKLFPDVLYRLPGMFPDNPRAGSVNGSLWTLPVEVRMYVIVALLGLTRVLSHRLIFNTLAAGIVLFYALAPDHFFLLHTPRHERLGLYFLLGVVFYVNARQLPLKLPGLAMLSAMLAGAYAIGLRNTPFNLIYAAWFTYLVLYLSFHPRLKLPDLARYGDFSYGLYLYAFPVTQTWIYLLGPDNPWLILALGFVVSLLLAVFSWFAVEKPALTLKGRLAYRG